LPSYRELLAHVKGEIEEIDPREAHEALASTTPPVLIDVRELDEFEQGAIRGAVHIPRGFLESRIETTVADRSTSIILSCQSGARSAFAARALADLGYTDVASLAGGFSGWKQNGYAWETPATLDADKRRRYSRHILIPEVGEAGQLRLLSSKVLMIGAGGLGSPSALYLAAAGVGTIGIIDEDTVDDSNLQRQILHTTDRIGMAKTESARLTLTALNPDVEVVEYRERLTSANIDRIIAGYDVIVDGTDNFPTRYLLNDASLKHGIPVVHASIFRFEGQLTVFKPHEGPCYRCLFPEPPPAELAPSCAEGGVLGVLPGIMGTLQATEALKLLLGIGDTLAGRLLLVDALESSFHEVTLRRDPSCPVCGEHADPITYIDYEQFCAGGHRTAAH
jgi:molybdopterin/thiamine biosynthesis adenylyltransferase/rhodanese-related sulfurtransferase